MIALVLAMTLAQLLLKLPIARMMIASRCRHASLLRFLMAVLIGTVAILSRLARSVVLSSV